MSFFMMVSASGISFTAARVPLLRAALRPTVARENRIARIPGGMTWGSTAERAPDP